VSGIERLFVALPLPARVAGLLEPLQPPSGKGVRPTVCEDMHITLHYLGNVQVEAVRAGLEGLAARPFAVDLGAPGAFTLKDGRRILWVGVEPSTPLVGLQRHIGVRLERLGFEPERRDYVPHITLARLSSGTAVEIQARFVEQAVPKAARQFSCETFALYASHSRPPGARYRLVQNYALGG
jgi:2'-5' RNA ligase